MSINVSSGIGQVADFASDVFRTVFPDPVERAKAEAALDQAERAGELSMLQTRLSAIIAEANSSDPWTSRARPSFMYVFYAVVLSMGVIAPMLGVFAPDQMQLFYANVSAGFGAIPTEMWTTFTMGYLGYAASRSYEKAKGLAK